MRWGDGRLSHRLYDRVLRLLPLWLRARAGAEMRASYAARLAAAPTGVARVWAMAHEIAGVLRVAVVARLTASARPSRAQRRGGAGARVLDTVLQDLRYAGRGMRRGPAVAVLAIGTLGLGVGASTAMFSVVDGVLLRPLPFERPEQIVLVWPTIEEWRDHPSLHASWDRGRFSPPELAEWLERQTSFAEAAGYTQTTARVPSGEGAERVTLVQATAGFFPLLRMQPYLGRLPQAEEPDPVVVLAHAYWQRMHGGSPDVIGRDLTINDRPVRVIGVLPPEFDLPGVQAELWRPLRVGGEEARRNHFLNAVGRLRDGVSLEQAEQETAALLGRMSAQDPGHITHRARLVSPTADATSNMRTPLFIFAGASVLLLLTACANVALLLLGAGADRVRELAVRGALGAGKARIAVQLMIESLALSLLGTAAALLVATGLLRVFVQLAPLSVPRIGNVGVDVRTFAVASVLAIVAGVLVGCFPALSLSRVAAADALRAGATTSGRNRLQRGLVIAELALATMLLVGAGLLTRTLGELQRVRPGFDTDGLFTVEVQLPWDRYYRTDVSNDEAAAGLASLHQRLLDAIRGVPGVLELAVSSDMPYSGDRGTNPVEPEGYVPAEGEQVDAARRFVSGNYFDVMRIAPVQGRVITPADDRADAERVMVVTDAFARHFWPDGRWLDRKVGFWGETYRVVGVIEDTREHDLRGDEDRFKFYVAERGGTSAAGNVLIRAALRPDVLAHALRERIWSVDRSLVITDLRTMQERIDASIAMYRYRMRLMIAFSVTACLFALLGIYSVMSRAVARRRRELGVRLALGAQKRSILSLVLTEGVRLAGAGAAVGVVGALVGSRVIESLLWGVPRTDPLTFAGIALSLLIAAVLATALPAHAAASVEPMSTLRS